MTDLDPTAPAAPGPGPGADPIVEVQIIRGRTFYPFRTHASTRWVVERIIRSQEYPFAPLPGWAPEVIVDVGANAGAFSLHYGLFFPEARVLAYEPCAETFTLLEQNTRELARVEVHRCGLHDHDGEAFLHYGRHNAGECSVVGGRSTRDAAETVALRRASAELTARGVDRIDTLKLDTEGCEVPILRDLAAWLPHTSQVLAEYHSAGDRLEIERLLGPAFVLYAASAGQITVGTVAYVRRQLVERLAPALLEP